MTRILILLLCLSVGYGHQNGEGITLKQLEGALEKLSLQQNARINKLEGELKGDIKELNGKIEATKWENRRTKWKNRRTKWKNRGDEIHYQFDSDWSGGYDWFVLCDIGNIRSALLHPNT